VNATLYWTLVAAGVTLYGARVALDILGAIVGRVRREARSYRRRREPRAAVPTLYIEAREPMTRGEALRLFARGLLR
jgi:hypothetical protein